MRKSIRWEVYSNGERNSVIETIKNVISSSDGCIMNFNMFSDLALTLSVEIEENKIQELHAALSEKVNMPEIRAEINQNSVNEWLVFMNISFTTGKGALKQEIPEVPG